LDEVYPILFIDAIHYSVRENSIIKKLAAYDILGINCEWKKEVLTIEIGENESSKYLLAVLNSLKNRAVKGYPNHLRRRAYWNPRSNSDSLPTDGISALHCALDPERFEVCL